MHDRQECYDTEVMSRRVALRISIVLLLTASAAHAVRMRLTAASRTVGSSEARPCTGTQRSAWL